MAGLLGIIYYHFDGSDGCDTCTSMTGNYDEEPNRPHPNCDCPITTEVFAGIEDFDYETVYKNKTQTGGSTYEQEHQGVTEFINNSHSKSKFTLSVSETIEGSISVSAEIEGIFSVSGTYKETETINRSIEVELEPGQGVSIDVIGILETVNFSAERWYIAYPIGGDPIEIYDETISDSIEAVSGARVEINDL